MKKRTGEIISGEWSNDLPVQAENPAFNRNELVDCGECRRTNPPTRSKCLYCAAPLPVSGEESRFFKPDLRQLEIWEKGFNLLVTGDSAKFEESTLAEISSIVKLEKEALREILASAKPLPVARIETEREAEIIQKRFRKSGVETEILPDEVLSLEKSPRRLRSMDFWDDRLVLILFNSDEIAEIKWEDVRLIVTGAIFERKVEATETRSKKGENKLLETNETASDESLFDIYSKEDRIGYRIAQNGFDFSCLGARKSLLAVENIKKLVIELSKRAPEVKTVEDYLKVRSLLAGVWQVEERTDSQGLKRESFGSFNLGNVTTVSNAAQFTKYSRLQRHLK